MKNLLKVGIVLLTVVLVGTYAYAALECKVELKASKKEVAKDTEFVVEAKLTDVEAEKGIIALGATLEYDDANLEFVKVEGKNGWATPSYNEENGKLVADRNEPATKAETAFEITFKSKDAAKKDIEITLKDVSLSDGDEEVKPDNATAKITITGESNKDSEEGNTTKGNTTPISTTTNTNTNVTRNTNTTGNTTGSTVKNTTTNTTAETDIPKAGDTNVVIMVFVAAIAVIGAIYFGKVNAIKKKEHDMNIEK